MIAMAKPKRHVAQFPKQELEAALVKWWASESLDRADDPFAKVPTKPDTLYSILPVLDSLAVVGSFLVIEEILKMEVPVGLVKRGGYCSCQEMLDDLFPKLRKLYEKNLK